MFLDKTWNSEFFLGTKGNVPRLYNSSEQTQILTLWHQYLYLDPKLPCVVLLGIEIEST